MQFMKIVHPSCTSCDPFRLLVGSSLENALEKDLLWVTTSNDVDFLGPHYVESFRL